MFFGAQQDVLSSVFNVMLLFQLLAKDKKKPRAGEPSFTKISMLINKMNSRVTEHKHEEALKFIKQAHDLFKKDVLDKPLESMHAGYDRTQLCGTMGADLMDRMQACYESLEQWENMGSACKLGLQYAKMLDLKESHACVAHVNMAKWLYYHGPRKDKTYERVLKHVKKCDKHLRAPDTKKNQLVMVLRLELELKALRSLGR